MALNSTVLRQLTGKRPFSLVLRGLILDALSVFGFWVGARGCMHGTVNSRGCPYSALFRSELIYECQPLLSLAHAGGQEACWLCTYDKLYSCWVGHMLGVRAARAKHWGVSSRSRRKGGIKKKHTHTKTSGIGTTF